MYIKVPISKYNQIQAHLMFLHRAGYSSATDKHFLMTSNFKTIRVFSRVRAPYGPEVR